MRQDGDLITNEKAGGAIGAYRSGQVGRRGRCGHSGDGCERAPGRHDAGRGCRR